MNDNVENSDDDVVWGAAAIGKVIRRTPRATFHLLESGLLPATRGKRWVASRKKLLAVVTGDEIAA